MSARYQAMLATAVSLGNGDARAQAVCWRQIVDIVAQAGSGLDVETRVLAFERLAQMMPSVDAPTRRFTAASLAGRTTDVGIVTLFAGDAPAIAAPFLSRTELDDRTWAEVIPAMPPASRNLLRNRRDLPAATVALLARFAPGDLALPAADVVPEQPGATQIRDLVARIEAYRQRAPAPDVVPQSLDRFAFEATANGLIDWVERAPREPLIGLDLANAAPVGGPGVDGAAAGAWRRRAPVCNARLVVGGAGVASGDWRIAASPVFNPRDGRFLGYRGEARRPLPGEHAIRSDAAMPSGADPDALRQLIHELRTPLNAIQGFAEMIDGQLIGPAALRYRERAADIVGQVRRLSAAINDLDSTVRHDPRTGAGPVDAEADLGEAVAMIVDRHRSSWAAQGIDVREVSVAGIVAVDGAALERMFDRLFAAVGAVSTADDRLEITMRETPAQAIVAISRPRALTGRDEEALLDPEYTPDGDWPDAPLLGLGFTLRMLAKLAEQAGGSLAIRTDRFELALPRPRTRVDEAAS